ncbi:MAG: hypothetical protein ACE5H0_09285 [Bacteroidota bacterium]
MLENFDPIPKIPPEKFPIAQLNFHLHELGNLKTIQMQLSELIHLADQTRPADVVFEYYEEMRRQFVRELTAKVFALYGQ